MGEDRRRLLEINSRLLSQIRKLGTRLPALYGKLLLPPNTGLQRRCRQ